jgi:micrococcal nuclease
MHVAVGRILAGVALLVTSLVSGAAAQAPATSGPAYVTRVMDGDTLCAELGGRLETVRYLGINTPWIEHPVYGPAAYASLSREANRRLVEGKWVRLVFDGPARDHFGRLIAYVWVGNVFVNAALVHKGYGEAATDSSSRYADYFQMLQDGARRHARGLWRDPSALAHHRPSATELAADTRDASSRALDGGGGRVFSAPAPFAPPVATSAPASRPSLGVPASPAPAPSSPSYAVPRGGVRTTR